jgi:lipopolysaccharide biosynthesis regulator YciM
MIQVDLSWLLVLPLLFAFGWLSARLELRQGRARRVVNLSSLVKAIQALSVGDRRRAIDPLLEAARESPDLLGIQRSLANLFRQQGEPDRAIEVRMSLLARDRLATSLSQELLLELAQDYLAAGIIDRAEVCLAELHAGPLSLDAARIEVQMFQQQRRWTDVLAVLKRLGDSTNDKSLRFHCYMELDDTAQARALWPDHPRLTQPHGVFKGRHLCERCGFRTEQHYWQCPGCMTWDSLTPLVGNAQPSAEA